MNGEIQTYTDPPEGSIVECVVEICAYMGPDGHLGYAMRMNGDRPITTFLGMLSMAQIKLAQDQE